MYLFRNSSFVLRTDIWSMLGTCSDGKEQLGRRWEFSKKLYKNKKYYLIFHSCTKQWIGVHRKRCWLFSLSLQLFVLLFSDILVQTEQDRSDQLHVMYEPVYLKHITQVDGQRNHSMYCLPSCSDKMKYQ